MTARCKSCEQAVKWVVMQTGGRMLVNLPPEKRVVLDETDVHFDRSGVSSLTGRVMDTYTSHFVTCPKADAHRRRKC